MKVASSDTKPHSTPKGVYNIRDGSRNRALHPSELLKLFLDAEGRAFAERFEASAQQITDRVADLESSLDSTVRSMGDQLGWAEHKIGDTGDTIESVLSYVHHLKAEADDISSRLRALFKQDDRDDPVKEAAKAKLLDEIVDQLTEDTDLYSKIRDGDAPISVTAKGKAAKELNKKDLEEIVSKALELIKKENQ